MSTMFSSNISGGTGGRPPGRWLPGGLPPEGRLPADAVAERLAMSAIVPPPADIHAERRPWRSGNQQPRSRGGEAAVDEDHLARYVVAGAAGQEDRHPLEILRLTVAADHGAGRQRGGPDRVGRDLRGERGGHEAGHDRVAAHAVRGPGLG